MEIILGAALLVGTALAHATTLLAVGGGGLPPEAARRFVAAAGGPSSARILIVTWATSQPERTFDSIAEELAPFIDRSRLQEAERAPNVDRTRLLAQLGNCTALFFTGGDQNKIMKVFAADAQIAQAVRDLYQRGLPVGGTSAGAAMLSSPMFTGEGDPTVIAPEAAGLSEGLGLIPEVIFDTHFIRRQRENRLFGAVLGHPMHLGVGIDEGNALWIEDDDLAEVLGPTAVMVVRSEGRSRLEVRLYSAGERFDVRTGHPRATGLIESQKSHTIHRLMNLH